MLLLARVILLALLLLPFPCVSADKLQSKTEQLKEIRSRIASVKQALKSDRERQDSMSADLQRIEQRIGRVSAEVEDIGRKVDDAEQRVADLKARYAEKSRQLQGERKMLAQQIRAAYATGREPMLRMLLNQQDPNRMERMLVYYDYLNAARGKRIREAVDALQELSALRSKLDDRVAQLKRLRASRQERMAALEDDRQQRRALLAKVGSRIDARGDELKRLRADASQLSDLVQRLQNSLADIPEGTDADKPFTSRKGHLAWPLDGPVLASYGSPRSAGMEWSGLLIGAKAGSPVHAVSQGRVVFSDWLRGLGLLIIIDHGNGYMTLYGHNQSLYKEAGDWVQGGDVIATVGSSGGHQRSALYFEVRARGKPVNPTAWLRPANRRG